MPSGPLVMIGDIQCTQTQVITPSGSCPTAGAHWTVTNMTQTREEIPQWAIICAIVGAFLICLFSLFFLLAKERRTTGVVQVMVQNGNFVHVTSVPVQSDMMVADVHNRVNYARSLGSTFA